MLIIYQIQGHEWNWIPLTLPTLQVFPLWIVVGGSYLSEVYPLDRSEQTSTCLSFPDNCALDTDNRLWKPSHIIRLLHCHCWVVYMPPQSIRSCLRFVTYNLSKRARLSFQLYKLPLHVHCAATLMPLFHSGLDVGEVACFP